MPRDAPVMTTTFCSDCMIVPAASLLPEPKNCPHQNGARPTGSEAEPRREIALAGLRRSRTVTVDFDDSFGKGLRRFLGQVVSDAAFDESVRVLAREFLGIEIGVRVWRTIGIAFEGKCGHGDDRALGKPLFQAIVFRLAFSPAESPPEIM